MKKIQAKLKEIIKGYDVVDTKIENLDDSYSPTVYMVHVYYRRIPDRALRHTSVRVLNDKSESWKSIEKIIKDTCRIVIKK